MTHYPDVNMASFNYSRGPLHQDKGQDKGYVFHQEIMYRSNNDFLDKMAIFN